MTTNKDFKRVVRARMQKTRESYTSARAQLLRRPVSPALPPSPASVPAPSPDDYAHIAGMSDAAVKAKTGCTWSSWVRALDHVQAYQWPHRAIAEYVHEKYQVPDWWTQMVTVGYERIKGLRAKGQRRGGTFEATRSRTFPVSVSRLYGAFSAPSRRAGWLEGVSLTVRTATRNRSMRITWEDGTSLELWFTSKGRSKSQVQVQHRKLPDQEAATRMKRYWDERLAALGTVLALSA